MSLKACVWKSPRVFKGGEPPWRTKVATLARVKENFCSISRRGMVCLGGGQGGLGWEDVWSVVG